MSQDPDAPDATAERKPYASPALEAHGSVEQLTQSVKQPGRASLAGASEESDTP